MKLGMLAKKGIRFLGDQSPVILTGIAVVGVVTTAVFAAKGHIKAEKLREEEKAKRKAEYNARKKEAEEKQEEFTEELKEMTFKEDVKLTWKCYATPALMGALTITSMVSATSISLQRNVALAAGLSIAEKKITEQEKAIKDLFGENKAQKVKEQMVKNEIKTHPIEDGKIIVTGGGDVLMFDEYSGRTFRSSVEKIRRAENALNRQLIGDMFVSLNEFYDMIGLDQIPLGDDYGWDVEKDIMSVEFTGVIREETGEPMIAIDFSKGLMPRYPFR